MPACVRRSTARSSEPPSRLRRRPIPNRGRLAGTCMPMPERNLVQAVRDALYEEMERDDRGCILGEDVGRKGGVFKATEGLQQRFGEQRVLDTPLAESSIAAVAQGLALAGLLPVAEMQFADYSFPGFKQIVNEIAKGRYRSNGDGACPAAGDLWLHACRHDPGREPIERGRDRGRDHRPALAAPLGCRVLRSIDREDRSRRRRL